MIHVFLQLVSVVIVKIFSDTSQLRKNSNIDLFLNNFYMLLGNEKSAEWIKKKLSWRQYSFFILVNIFVVQVCVGL